MKNIQSVIYIRWQVKIIQESSVTIWGGYHKKMIAQP